MASIDLPPSTDSNFKRFIAMVRYKPKPPPKGTTLSGKTAIITGSNVGIGFATAQEMLNIGLSHLIMAVRSIEKGEQAAASLRKAHPQARIDVWNLDMLAYDSIHAFVEKCRMLQSLNIVILNAAFVPSGFSINPSTGHETAFQTNYLSTALLAIILLPVLQSKNSPTSPGRLTTVTSALALHCEVPKVDPLIPSFDVEKKMDVQASMDLYTRTKLLLMMLTLKLSEHVRADAVIVNTVEPGFTNGTGLSRNANAVVQTMAKIFGAMAGRTPTQAAYTYIDAVTVKGKETHGSMIMDEKVHPFHPEMYTPEGKAVTDRIWNETLWEFESAGAAQIISAMRAAT